MGDWSLGSVAEQVQNLIEDVPSNISGLPIQQMADRKRQYVEEYTGNVIGSNSIGIRYQDVILNLTAAEVARLMNIYGVDADSITLGDFAIRPGGESNLSVTAQKFEERSFEMLRQLGRRVSFKKANG